MEEYREEVVRREPVGPVEEVVEERVTTPVVEQRVTTTPVVEERVAKPAPPVETVRRRSWWRPTVQRDVVATNVYAAPTYYDSTLDQFVRIMWYLLGLLEGLLAIRFILALAAANPNNGFASLIYAITGVFVAPFRTLFATPAVGGSVFEMYTLVAMLVYFLAWWAIVRLVEVVANRPVDS
jgi:YGGT family